MIEKRQKLISKTAAFGVASALVLTGLTGAASAATIASANKPALQNVTINVAIAYPAPPKAHACGVH